MDLLPKIHSEFSSLAYWESFYKKRDKKGFEWQVYYDALNRIITLNIDLSSLTFNI